MLLGATLACTLSHAQLQAKQCSAGTATRPAAGLLDMPANQATLQTNDHPLQCCTQSSSGPTPPRTRQDDLRYARMDLKSSYEATECTWQASEDAASWSPQGSHRKRQTVPSAFSLAMVSACNSSSSHLGCQFGHGSIVL